MYEHVMNNQEHVKNTYEQLRTFKHIQGNLNNHYYALILNFHHENINKQLGMGIIFSCKIHMVEEIWWRKGFLMEVLRVEEKKS